MIENAMNENQLRVVATYRFFTFVPNSLRTLANPKSQSLTVPSEVMRRFSGLMSRWTQK